MHRAVCCSAPAAGLGCATAEMYREDLGKLSIIAYPILNPTCAVTGKLDSVIVPAWYHLIEPTRAFGSFIVPARYHLIEPGRAVDSVIVSARYHLQYEACVLLRKSSLGGHCILQHG